MAEEGFRGEMENACPRGRVFMINLYMVSLCLEVIGARHIRDQMSLGGTARREMERADQSRAKGTLSALSRKRRAWAVVSWRTGISAARRLLKTEEVREGRVTGRGREHKNWTS